MNFDKVRDRCCPHVSSCEAVSAFIVETRDLNFHAPPPIFVSLHAHPNIIFFQHDLLMALNVPYGEAAGSSGKTVIQRMRLMWLHDN
jgi:hypothetical protein